MYQALKHRSLQELHIAAGESVAHLLGELLCLAGPAKPAIMRLNALPLPQIVEPDIQSLNEIIEEITHTTPDLTLTIDPVEIRDFKYEAGVCFTFFAHGIPSELGRGGRYTIDNERVYSEPATGFTLYTNTISLALPLPKPKPRVYIPFQTPLKIRENLRKQGWIIINSLKFNENQKLEAERLKCSHFFDGTTVQPLIHKMKEA